MHNVYGALQHDPHFFFLGGTSELRVCSVKRLNKKEEVMQPSPSDSNSQAGLGSELSADVQQLGTSAGDRIHTELDARKGGVADQAKSLSSAITRTADGLDEGAPPWLKSAFQQGAQQVQRLADTLEQKDSRAILSDIQSIARNNPGTFLAGCAALGFVAARIFKAGAPGHSASQSPSRFPQLPVDEPSFRPSAQRDRSASPAGEFA